MKTDGAIGETLKAADRDRYFATLVIPTDRRPAVQALYAFSAEVAAVSARVRDPAAGEIRLQWWRDALAGEGHGDVRANPVAGALLDALEKCRLPTAPLLRLLDARRFDLYADPMPDLPAFEGYAGATTSILIQLAAMILNDGEEPGSGDAAGHLGVAQAFTGHLRAFGYHASRGRIFLPWSILAASGVREEEVFSGTVSEGLLAALEQIHEIAADHLGKAKAAIAALPRPLWPAFAAVALVGPDLRAVARNAENPFSPPSQLADWMKIAALAWWGWRNGR